jgi:predicted HTH transcriptional regulator
VLQFGDDFQVGDQPEVVYEATYPGYSSIRAMAEQTGLSQASVRHHLRRMQTDNMLRRIGPDKGGHWQVIDTP